MVMIWTCAVASTRSAGEPGYLSASLETLVKLNVMQAF
jgi:hypothetical protein